MVLWSYSSCTESEDRGFKSLRTKKSFSIQINKNLFAEVRAKEKGNILLIASVRALAVPEKEETEEEVEASFEASI